MLKSVSKRLVTGALAAAGLVTVLAGTAGEARAQEFALQRWALKVGAFVPQQERVRRATSDAQIMMEMDATIQQFGEQNQIVSSVISVGYSERDNLRLFPITLAQVHRNPGLGGFDFYYGFGAGVYFTRIRGLEDTGGNTKGLLGGHLLGGLDLTRDVFGEAKYHIVSRYNGASISGLQLSMGVRF